MVLRNVKIFMIFVIVVRIILFVNVGLMCSFFIIIGSVVLDSVVVIIFINIVKVIINLRVRFCFYIVMIDVISMV